MHRPWRAFCLNSSLLPLAQQLVETFFFDMLRTEIYFNKTSSEEQCWLWVDGMYLRLFKINWDSMVLRARNALNAENIIVRFMLGFVPSFISLA